MLQNATRKHARWVIASSLAMVLLVGGVAWAAIPNSETHVIQGCHDNRVGFLRVIDAEAGETCTRWETAISWNQEGVPGQDGADGTNGADGLPGADGMNGTDGLPGADGTNGTDGKTVLNGTTDPTTEGTNGDFYLNTATSTLFGPKTTTGWGTGTSLVGPTGATGAKGDKGETGSPGDSFVGSSCVLADGTTAEVALHVAFDGSISFMCTDALLTITPAEFNFGAVGLGLGSGVTTRSFVVTNTGGHTSGTLDLDFSGDFDQFMMMGTGSCSGTTALASGASCQVDIRFNPISAGTHVAFLTVSAPGTSSVATLSGVGI